MKDAGIEYPVGMAPNSPTSTSQLECSFSSFFDPGNWDPNFSVDLLLQDDDMTIRNLVSGIDNIHLAPKMDSSILNIGTFSHRHDGSQMAHPISNPASSTRTEKHVPKCLKALIHCFRQ